MKTSRIELCDIINSKIDKFKKNNANDVVNELEQILDIIENNDTIFVTTVFEKIDKNYLDDEKKIFIGDFGDRHCVGWHDTMEEAVCAVENNFADMHEGYFEYAIIEEMEPGVRLADISRKLFKWDNEKQQYNEIEFPIEVLRSSNFGMGG